MEREYVFAAQKGWNADEADGAGWRGFFLLRKMDGTRMERMARVDTDFNFAAQKGWNADGADGAG